MQRPETTARTAVRTYLENKQICTGSTTLASTLNGLATKMIETAQNQAVQAINKKPAGTARQKSSAQGKISLVNAGKAVSTFLC